MRETGNERVKSYKTLAHQILAFERQTRAGKCTLRAALRDAAMVGACEERSRALAILKVARDTREAATEITSIGVLTVLGYDE